VSDTHIHLPTNVQLFRRAAREVSIWKGIETQKPGSHSFQELSFCTLGTLLDWL